MTEIEKEIKKPKYNVGDAIHINERITSMVLRRDFVYDEWFYTIAGEDGVISESQLDGYKYNIGE